jgi:ADP-L-glycero-D-manno-heptose 6-epimerase
MALRSDELIVITGGAGFIAKYVVRHLNRLGFTNIVLFDRYDKMTLKHLDNLTGLTFRNLESHENLIEFIDERKEQVKTIIHLGANADTTGNDTEDYLWNNYELSKGLLEMAVGNEIRFIYASSASVYGDGSKGFDDDFSVFHQYKPMNIYAWSKYLFDQYIIQNNLSEKVLGLRLFNVFGADSSKGDMRCIVTRAFETIKEKKKLELFDVKSLRDFIWADDVARFMVESIKKNSYGIINFGTGVPHSFKSVCEFVYKSMSFEPNFEMIALPAHLEGKYQNFTQSNVQKFQEMLHKYKYEFRFSDIEDAVAKTVQELSL